jgi:hypothetical protein
MLAVLQIIAQLVLVWGEESLELAKAHGNFLGERAMAEAVG